MRIEHLALTSFRTYESLVADFPPGPQVVVGPNATGKTNLLESMAMLGCGRSHRAAQDGDVITWGHGFARIEADLGDSDRAGPTSAALIISRTTAGNGRKRALVNGVPRRPATLRGVLPVVLFAPEDMLLVVGSPSQRRHAIDALVEQTVSTAGAAMATYARALTQRNNLLRAIRDGGASPSELRFWDSTVVEEGSRIVDWRREILLKLMPSLATGHREIAPDEPALELQYQTNAEPAAGESTREAISRRLAETAQKELWNGVTLIGPHRDDVVFRAGDRDLASYASRGQQRTAILAFKLAQLDLVNEVLGMSPLLLLDDVFSELDPERRAHLVRRIGELPQAFVTTTTTDDLDPALVRAATTWQVSPGQLTQRD
jgi:DNA replication and repair protein RecF